MIDTAISSNKFTTHIIIEMSNIIKFIEDAKNQSMDNKIVFYCLNVSSEININNNLDKYYDS